MEEEIKLVILETSDTHGCVFPIDYPTNKVKKTGLLKIASAINEVKNKEKNVILIDNGDTIQGTPLTYYYAKESKDINPIILALNYMKYDAAVIGNHEFNYGMNVLKSVTSKSHFPWLSANILNCDNGSRVFGKPYIIKNVMGKIKVGILGLTTQYVPNWENPKNIEGVCFEDAVVCAKKWVKYLREEEKVDFLIVSYHGGFERDIDTGEETQKITGENQGYDICSNVPGIDILLTGHQHRVIFGKKVNGVNIIQPGSHAGFIGKVEVHFTLDREKWIAKSIESSLLKVEEYEVDNNLCRKLMPYEEETQKWLDRPIGKAYGNMEISNSFEARLRDNPYTEFVNKVQMINSGADISCTSIFDDASPGFKENITIRDIVSNYIYPNTLKVIRVKGKDIKAALEKSASYFDKYDGSSIKIHMDPKSGRLFQVYNYDMWEGIEYKINISKEVGERVVFLNYKGKPLDMEKEYDVVMNNYRALGGGEYTMYKDKPVIKDIPIDMSELITNYIFENKIIKAECDHNWEVIHD